MSIKQLKIVLFGNPVLRQKAKHVSVFHKKLHSVIDSIAHTLDSREDGAALAATQIGILKRITVIDYEGEYFEMINPEIIESGGEIIKSEGCLSFPGYTGLVPRAEFVKVKFQDRNGNESVIERSGNMARCIQHEIDHLDGILYIDRMKETFLTHNETDEKLNVEEVLLIANNRSK